MHALRLSTKEWTAGPALVEEVGKPSHNWAGTIDGREGGGSSAPPPKLRGNKGAESIGKVGARVGVEGGDQGRRRRSWRPPDDKGENEGGDDDDAIFIDKEKAEGVKGESAIIAANAKEAALSGNDKVGRSEVEAQDATTMRAVGDRREGGGGILPKSGGNNKEEAELALASASREEEFEGSLKEEARGVAGGPLDEKGGGNTGEGIDNGFTAIIASEKVEEVKRAQH